MNTTIIPAQELTATQVARWTALQEANPHLASPFFRPEYTQAVAAVRGGNEVAILEKDGTPIGFFPFQRRYGRVGRPVGGPISDFHGLIVEPGHKLDVTALIRDCRLSAWHFDHLLAEQREFEGCHWSADQSPYIDTSRGFETYCIERRQAGTEVVKKTLQKRRKLEREGSTLRFEMMTKDPAVFKNLVAWKAEQYHQSRLYNMFASEWTKQLFTQLLERTDVAFQGVMSALYIDERLAAVLFSVRSHRVLHAWSITYSREFSRCSPGYQLLVELIRAAQGMGIDRIDLGKGDQLYKSCFMSGATPLLVGSVDTRRMAGSLRHLWHCAHARVRESILRGPLTTPWRWVKRKMHQAQFR